VSILIEQKATPDSPNLTGRTLRAFFRNPTARLGGVVLAACLLIALLAERIAPYNPLYMASGQELTPPSLAHLLGTDEFGRDLLSRIIFGMRMSLMVSISAVLLGGIPGILSGLYTGYVEGVASAAIMRFWDGLLAFPPLLLAIMFSALLGPGPFNAAIALGVISVPEFSRIVRSLVLAEKQKDYVLASVSVGVRLSRLLLRTLLPNILSPIFVQVTIAMGSAIALEAALSFIGLGIQPPNPSLGSMLNLSRPYFYHAWWYAVFPGVAIVIMLMSLNWMSEALMETINPRLSFR
jgi:peptide/nickel transport system permease protein